MRATNPPKTLPFYPAINTLAHPREFAVQTSKGRLQLAIELPNGVFDSLWPQHSTLEFREQTPLKDIGTLFQTI